MWKKVEKAWQTLHQWVVLITWKIGDYIGFLTLDGWDMFSLPSPATPPFPSDPSKGHVAVPWKWSSSAHLYDILDVVFMNQRCVLEGGRNWRTLLLCRRESFLRHERACYTNRCRAKVLIKSRGAGVWVVVVVVRGRPFISVIHVVVAVMAVLLAESVSHDHALHVHQAAVRHTSGFIVSLCAETVMELWWTA